MTPKFPEVYVQITANTEIRWRSSTDALELRNALEIPSGAQMTFVREAMNSKSYASLILTAYDLFDCT